MSLFDPRNIGEIVTNPSKALRRGTSRADLWTAVRRGLAPGPDLSRVRLLKGKWPDPVGTVFLSTSDAFFRTFLPSPPGRQSRRLAHSEMVERVEPDPIPGTGWVEEMSDRQATVTL